uniref:Uncharacterized protein n=2 Tax=Cyprinus carpio TaxID=7962 RepID=A0A9R1SSG0_CYPCA
MSYIIIHLTARVGEEVMFDDLPRDAESVECLTNTGSIDVWRREQGVLTDRLTDNDGHLIIKNFRSSDAGTYRVLDSTGGVLVTVTLTESPIQLTVQGPRSPNDSNGYFSN